MFSAYISMRVSDKHPDHNFVTNGESYDDIYDNLVERGIMADYFYNNLCQVSMRSLKGCECRYFCSFDAFCVVICHPEEKLEEITEFLDGLRVSRQDVTPELITPEQFEAWVVLINEEDTEEFFMELFDHHINTYINPEDM